MKELFFLKHYIKNPSQVGAILPSSKELACKMVEDIDFQNALCIVEYGPGTGVFTEKLLEKRKKDTILILIEYSSDFCNILKDRFKNEENIYIVNDTAENIKKYLELYNVPRVDYIVSGLPFASLPKAVSTAILSVTREVLGNKGKFITFQYTKLKKAFINKSFQKIYLKYVLKNIPPAFVFVCSNSGITG